MDSPLLSHELVVGSWAPQPLAIANEDRAWHEFVVKSDAGIPVNADMAITHTPIWHGLLLLGGDTGALRMEQKRRQGDELHDETRHVAHRLTAVRPHRLMSPNAWFELMTTRMLVWGNAVCEIARGPAGKPLPVSEGGGLTPLPPETTRAEYDDFGKLWITTRFLDPWTRAIEKVWIDPDDTFHIRNISPDGFWGYSLWEQIGKNRIANGQGYLKHSNATFSNAAKPDFLFSFPGRVGQEGINFFKEMLKKENAGLDNRGRQLVIDNGMVATQLSMSLEDAQYAELVKLDREMCASLLGIPAVMLNALERATFNNIEEQNRWYINRTLSRILNKYVEESMIKLLTPREQERFIFQWDLDPLLKGTLKERYEAYSQAISSRWMSGNEVRKKEGLNPVDGLDEFQNPFTTTDGGDSGEEPEQPEDNSEAIQELQEQYARLLARELRLLVRRETQLLADAATKERNFLEWIDVYFKERYDAEMSEILPKVGHDYCVQRHQFALNLAGECTSREQLRDRLKKENSTISVRVKGLLDGELL